ncbi:hypothetical protein F8154_02545 [Alkaliphilus pronyensis]|uniref:Uncharacterized protein n=1 Tax=Alkaliphilus pronyensis TaxID=1482732 RepID=A0A6I0FH37_9FIRM|nr:hypothetical protein [Alkaliphilus pronyensis]KAB3537708.1 hypothetical protein F8154_02545 [Alkaliphilus pronyensis]
MSTLKAVIRLQEIKSTLENRHFNCEHFNSLCHEFECIKLKLLKSNFAFDNIVCLLSEVENTINAVKSA